MLTQRRSDRRDRRGFARHYRQAGPVTSIAREQVKDDLKMAAMELLSGVKLSNVPDISQHGCRREFTAELH
jgi:hypothetical protein